jgi:hypothetical protein
LLIDNKLADAEGQCKMFLRRKWCKVDVGEQTKEEPIF